MFIDLDGNNATALQRSAMCSSGEEVGTMFRSSGAKIVFGILGGL
jgi:hypothetical protein